VDAVTSQGIVFIGLTPNGAKAAPFAATFGNFTLTFDAPEFRSGSGTIDYANLNGDPLWETIIWPSAQSGSLTISGLDPNQTYYIQYLFGDTRGMSQPTYLNGTQTFTDSSGNQTTAPLTFGGGGTATELALITVRVSGSSSLRINSPQAGIGIGYSAVLINAALAANAPAGTRTVVPANPLWTDTGVRVTSGDAVNISAYGLWSWGGGHISGPDGDPNYTAFWDLFYSGGLGGSLVAYVGADPYQGHWGDSTFFPQTTAYWKIGSAADFVSPISGELWLGFNDDAVDERAGDNAGAVSAQILAGRVISPPASGPPQVFTGTATAITANSATLNGSVNPDGLSTTAYFQWGTSTEYGNTVPTPVFSCGGGNNTIGVSVQNLSGLAPGTTYHYRLVASNSAGTANGADQTFTTFVYLPPVSAANSTLTATPTSAPADGCSQITAVVTLRDGNGNPVAGKTVSLWLNQIASGPAFVPFFNPPQGTSDQNGQVMIEITSAAPCSGSLVALDGTDSVMLQPQVSVQFTTVSTLPGPNSQLQGAIKSLYEGTAQLLNGTPATGMDLAKVAKAEGQLGPTFWSLAEGAGLQALVGALFQAASEVIGGLEAPLVGSAEQIVTQIFARYLVKTTLDVGNVGIDQIISASVQEDKSSSGGVLVTRAQSVATTCTTDQSSVLNQEQNLLAGVPPCANGISGALASDLTARLGANQVMQKYQNQMYAYFAAVAKAAQTLPANTDLPVTILKTATITGGSTLFSAASEAAETPDPGVDSFQFLAAELQDYNNENNYLAENLAVGNAILGVAGSASQMMNNINSAFTEISQPTGTPPAPPTCTIQNATAYFVTGTTTISPSTVPGTWVGDQTVTSVTVPTFNDVVSDMSINNTGTSDATFMTYALFTSDIEGLDAVGPVPQVCVVSTYIPAGGTASVPIDYFANNHGGEVLTISPISICVLAYNASGVFLAGSTTLTAAGSRPSTESRPMDDRSTDAIGNPVRSYVSQITSNQTYQAQIWVENPFVIPLTATVTPAIPTGLTVLSTDGTLQSSSIVWTRIIAPSNAVESNFTFSVPAIPGGLTNVPAPTVTFSDTNGNSCSLQGVAPSFSGLFPVQVNGLIPLGIPGVDTPIQIAVTNVTATNQSGSLTVVLIDGSGNTVTNVSQSFSLNGSLGTNLDVTLPGLLSAGSYTLTGSLDMNGGSGEVFSGTYFAPAPTVALHLGSAPALTANGLTLALRGPVGDYLIEASSDISNSRNWQPILFYSTTNSPFYYFFTDTSATNFNYRFYRAVKQ